MMYDGFYTSSFGNVYGWGIWDWACCAHCMAGRYGPDTRRFKPMVSWIWRIYLLGGLHLAIVSLEGCLSLSWDTRARYHFNQANGFGARECLLCDRQQIMPHSSPIFGPIFGDFLIRSGLAVTTEIALGDGWAGHEYLGRKQIPAIESLQDDPSELGT